MNYKIFKTDLKPWLKKFFFEKFSYIIKTVTGTTISISDVTREKIVSLTLSKESTQDGTPTPENPVEVKTVTGYRNLFDKDNALYVSYLAYNNNFTAFQSTGGTNPVRVYYLPCEPNKTYCYSKKIGSYCRFGSCVEIPANGVSITATNNDSSSRYATITTGVNDNYIFFSPLKSSELSDFDFDEVIEKVLITEGTEELPYVPYGNNWVYTAVSNGTDTNYYTIPLNGNEIAGIGDYKDELVVDKNGKCWLNKKTGKAIFDGSNDENWIKESLAVGNNYYIPISNPLRGQQYKIFNNIGEYTGKLSANYNTYISSSGNLNYVCTEITSVDDFKTMLSNQNMIIYYILATENLIDLNYNVDIRLFNGINNITNSEDMNMTIKYYSK